MTPYLVAVGFEDDDGAFEVVAVLSQRSFFCR